MIYAKIKYECFKSSIDGTKTVLNKMASNLESNIDNVLNILESIQNTTT